MNRRPVYYSQLYGNSNSEPDENPPVYEKPSMSYANLIAEAIIQSPEKALVLSDIYEAINAKYPYYDLESQGWQNSIRHNLSLNKNFTKEKKDKTGLKRGWYWKLSDGHSFFAPKKKAFQCDECNKAFSSIGGLNYHKNIVHEEMRKNEDTGTHGFSDLPTALEDEDDNTKEVHKFFVINENGTEVFSCSKCGQNFSGFDGQHIKNCWNNESDNGKKTEEYPCESKTFDKRIGKIEKRNTELKATEANQVVTDFEEIEEETQSKTFVKRSGQGVEKCNSEFKASEANQEPYVVTDFEESEEETDEESN